MEEQFQTQTGDAAIDEAVDRAVETPGKFGTRAGHRGVRRANVAGDEIEFDQQAVVVDR